MLCFQDTPGSKALHRDFTNRTEHLCLVSCRSFMWLVWRQHLWNWHLCWSWIQGGFRRINSQIKSISWNENSLTKSFFTHRWHFITGNPVEICFTRIFIFQKIILALIKRVCARNNVHNTDGASERRAKALLRCFYFCFLSLPDRIEMLQWVSSGEKWAHNALCYECIIHHQLSRISCNTFTEETRC